MQKNIYEDLQCKFDELFREIFSLETLITYTHKICLNYEITSNYYNLPQKEQLNLSSERNNYINMLSIASEKILNLKKINLELENICYNNTPTIAADK